MLKSQLTEVDVNAYMVKVCYRLKVYVQLRISLLPFFIHRWVWL